MGICCDNGLSLSLFCWLSPRSQPSLSDCAAHAFLCLIPDGIADAKATSGKSEDVNPELPNLLLIRRTKDANEEEAV